MVIFDWMDAVTAPDRVVWRRYKKARELLLQGNYPEALTIFDSAVRMNPTDPNLYVGRGIAHYRTGEYEAAITDFSIVIRLGFSDLDTIYFNRAAAHTQLDNIDAAINDYAEALAIGLDLEHAISALEQRGYLLIRKDDLQRAESNFLKLLDLGGEAVDKAHLGLATVRFELKDYDGAINHLSKMLEINPDNEIGLYRRGFMHLRKGNWEQAFADYDKAVSLNPAVPHSYNNRGFVRIQLGEWEAAQKDFEQALKLEDKFPYAYAGIGDLYFLSGEYESALEAFNKAHKLGSDIKGITASLAVTHHALNQVERAVEIWRGLVEQNSNYRDADWVKDEHMWRNELVEEARKLIARL